MNLKLSSLLKMLSILCFSSYNNN